MNLCLPKAFSQSQEEMRKSFFRTRKGQFTFTSVRLLCMLKTLLSITIKSFLFPLCFLFFSVEWQILTRHVWHNNSRSSLTWLTCVCSPWLYPNLFAWIFNVDVYSVKIYFTKRKINTKARRRYWKKFLLSASEHVRLKECSVCSWLLLSPSRLDCTSLWPHEKRDLWII